MSVFAVNLKLKARIKAGDEPEWLKCHPRRAYIVQLALATPPWFNRAEVRRLDRKAKELSKQRGVKYVVDHEIPVTNKRVCGLNVHTNMQIITHQQNAKKLNHWCEWHGEMFAEPEQFAMRF